MKNCERSCYTIYKNLSKSGNYMYYIKNMMYKTDCARYAIVKFSSPNILNRTTISEKVYLCVFFKDLLYQKTNRLKNIIVFRLHALTYGKNNLNKLVLYLKYITGKRIKDVFSHVKKVV